MVPWARTHARALGRAAVALDGPVLRTAGGIAAAAAVLYGTAGATPAPVAGAATGASLLLVSGRLAGTRGAPRGMFGLGAIAGGAAIGAAMQGVASLLPGSWT